MQVRQSAGWAKQESHCWRRGPKGPSSYFDSPSVQGEMASVLFVFQGETSEHLRCSFERHAGLELQAAPVDKNA